MQDQVSPDARLQRLSLRGEAISVLSALLWLPQAGVLAWGLGVLLTEPAAVPAFGAALVFLAFTLLRSLLDAAALRALSDAADTRIDALRDEIIRTEARTMEVSGHGGAGALAALTGEKLDLLRPYLLRYRPARLRSSVIPVAILLAVLWHSWAVALVLVVAGPLIPVFMALVGWAAKEASERQMAEVGGLSDLLVDRLAALSDLRLIGAGPALIDGFARASDALRDRTLAVLRIAFLSSTVLELFAALGVAMVAIWVGFTLLGELTWGAWGAELTPAAGIFLLLLAPEFFQPLRDLAAAWHDRAAADAVMDEVDAWREDDRAMRAEVAGGPVVLPDRPLVRLRGVEMRGRTVSDLTVQPGESLAIMGPSGSGKTTILRLLAGLDRPDAGAVLLDGVALDDQTADAWRARIGWMPQGPHFLNRSLRHNIGFGDAVRAEVISAARVQTVIAALPKGMQTRLGERGAGLSGGEARRVTLARALNARPQIILADEPTADLDAETASAVVDGLLAFAAAGGTLVVATHDPVLAARLDRTLTLKPVEGTA